MEITTNSRRADFLACRRLHYFKYILRRRPLIQPESLAFGTTWHDALEAWWISHMIGEPQFALDRALAAIGRIDPAAERRARSMVVGYDARWTSTMSDLEVLGVEQEFETDLVNPDTGRKSQTYRQAGKIDVIVRRRSTFAEGIIEHKSTTSSLEPTSTYVRRLRLDGQVSTYYDGARALGFDPTFCIYDVVVKPAARPLLATPEENRRYTKGDGCRECGGKVGERGTGKLHTLAKEGKVKVWVPVEGTDDPCPTCKGEGWKPNEAPRLDARQRADDETLDAYETRVLAGIAGDPEGTYQRFDLVRLDGELDEHRADIWNTTKSMHETITLARQSTDEMSRHARNTDACVRYGRLCEYFNVCTRAGSIDDPTVFRDSRSHEELNDKRAAGAE